MEDRHAHIYAYVCAHIHTCVHRYTHIYVYAHLCTPTYTSLQPLQINTQTHIHKHMYTHIKKRERSD